MSELTEGNAAAEWAAAGFVGTVHASCVAISRCGVLIAGPSGVGKSDLALRLIDRGAALVSDDYTLIEQGDEGRVVANPAPNIEGQIEVRGIGIIPLSSIRNVPIGLVVIGAPADQIERLPRNGRILRLCGVDIPLLYLSLLESSAPLKVELALQKVRQGPSEAIST